MKMSKTSRLIASTIEQLKLGHGYFKSYLYRLLNYNSPRCRGRCTAKQTPEHLLRACPLYRQARVETIDKIGTDLRIGDS